MRAVLLWSKKNFDPAHTFSHWNGARGYHPGPNAAMTTELSRGMTLLDRTTHGVLVHTAGRDEFVTLYTARVLRENGTRDAEPRERNGAEAPQSVDVSVIVGNRPVVLHRRFPLHGSDAQVALYHSLPVSSGENVRVAITHPSIFCVFGFGRPCPVPDVP